MIALVVGLLICVAFAVLTALAQTGHLRRWWEDRP